MTVENCGREVTFDKRPERVLAVNPEAATLLAAAGADDKISSYVGFVVDVPFGEAEGPVRAAQQLGSWEDLSLETIIGARPDVVIGDHVKYMNDLAANGIETLIVSGYCESAGFPLKGDPSVFELIDRDIEAYGTLFGTRETATRSVADLRKRIAAVQAQVANEPKTSTAALYMYADAPLAAYGNQAVVHDQLSILGLQNVFADTNERYFEPNVEEIIARDPELLIPLFAPEQSKLPTPQSVIQNLRSRGEVAMVKAIRDDAILPLLYYYSGPGPLAIDGLEQLAKQIVERK